MVLSAQEESLIAVVRALPPDVAVKVLDWACQLADLAGGRIVQWSGSWTDEDLAEATSASLDSFNKLVPQLQILPQKELPAPIPA